MRVGAGLALKGDLSERVLAMVVREAGEVSKGEDEAIWRARSRSAGVSTPSGTVSTSPTWIDIPASSALELLELLSPFERRRRQRDEASER